MGLRLRAVGRVRGRPEIGRAGRGGRGRARGNEGEGTKGSVLFYFSNVNGSKVN